MRSRIRAESSLFLFALDQVHAGAGTSCEGAGDHEAGEAGAGAEIDPCPGVRREVKPIAADRRYAGSRCEGRGIDDEFRVPLRQAFLVSIGATFHVKQNPDSKQSARADPGAARGQRLVGPLVHWVSF